MSIRSTRLGSPWRILVLIFLLLQTVQCFLIQSPSTSRSIGRSFQPPSTAASACHANNKSKKERILLYAAEKSDENNGDDSNSDQRASTSSPQRRDFFTQAMWSVVAMAPTLQPHQLAQAAPPIAVISEELGYFPVQNSKGEMVYVPKRVQRPSSEQAIALAQKLTQTGAVMYGAFWCPHCARQKELLGREAFSYIKYVECAPKGYGAQPTVCLAKQVDGYPTWVFKDKTILGGERPLEELAQKVGISFQSDLEENVPPPLGSTACKQK